MFLYSDIYVANASARKSFNLGGSDVFVPCITILIENAINSSKSFAVNSYSLKSVADREAFTTESGPPFVLKKL